MVVGPSGIGDLSPVLEHEDATPVPALASTEDIDLGDDDNMVQPKAQVHKVTTSVTVEPV